MKTSGRRFTIDRASAWLVRGHQCIPAEFIEQRFNALETRLDERRESDLEAVKVAKTTADAAFEATTSSSAMRGQAIEAQRQLDKLTDTYATKENLSSWRR